MRGTFLPTVKASMRRRIGQTSFARRLRQRQTEAEQFLWYRLRNRELVGARFRRQEPLGPYFADFVCLEKKLIIEVDGSQHTQEAEAERNQWLQDSGFRVVRFWDNEVLLNIDGVLERIIEELEVTSPSP